MSSKVPYSPLRRRDPSISGDEATPRSSRSASRSTRPARASSSRPVAGAADELELRRLPRSPRSARVDDADDEKTSGSEAETDSEAGDLEALLRDPESDEAKASAALEEDLISEDPVAVVRRTIPETDDPTLPALTLRAALIGSVFACIGGGLSQVSRPLSQDAVKVCRADRWIANAQLFFYKSNSPSFSSYFVILVTLPLGRWLARVTPKRSIHLPWLGEVPLNPGPFNIK